jgi:hypothetical protein
MSAQENIQNGLNVNGGLTVDGSNVATPAQVILSNTGQTVNPGIDNASQYLLPSGSLNAATSLTLGTSGSPATNLVVQVIRRDLTGNTYAIVNGGAGAGTLLTFSASPKTAQGGAFKFDGTNWSLLNFFYVA